MRYYTGGAPLCSYSHQEAAQVVQVGPSPRLQQHLRTGQVPVGHGKVQWAAPQVTVVLYNPLSYVIIMSSAYNDTFQ